jgi:hypothetical protein
MATNVTALNNVTNILPGSVSSLVLTNNQTRKYGVAGDYVEMNVYDLNNTFIFQIVPFLNFKIPGNYPAETETYTQELDFSPEDDAQQNSLGFGSYIFEYNILRPKVINDVNKIFFIKEISANRTELRLGTNSSATTLTNGALSFINEFQSLGYFKEFYINLGNGILLPCINIALDENTDPPTLLIKLLNPLPGNFNTLATLNIVDKISDSKAFQVGITPDVIKPTYASLRSANFDIELDNVRANPTQYFSFNQIIDSKSSVNSQLQSLLGLVSSSQFSINIDYTDLSNFIHYSSAVNRLDGFKYKLNLIETYTAASSSAASFSTIAAQQDAQNYKNQLNNVIQSFDGYEKFLYYESSSFTWPKQNSVKPYINYASTSSQGLLWYSSSYDSASLYDINNQNYLIYALPTYINENSSNNNLFKYISSMGLMFDEIWLYTKAITDLYQSKNNLTKGISKDLVYFALQSMGVNVYPDQDGENVFQYLYGVTPDGKYLPNTGSYETLVTASQYSMPGQDQEKGIYKRLYHNLPLLLKSKGTNRFIQYLNTIFGIPTTIMGYTEYGGVDKSTATTEYEFDRFTYGLNTISNNTITIPWNYTSQSFNRTGYNDIVPNGIELRFKAFTTSSNILSSTYATQSLFYNGSNYSLNLLYTNTGSNNSIYSGSVGDFGYLQFKLGTSTIITPTIPIFTTGSDGETSWYSILVQRSNPNLRIGDVSTSQTYTVYVKNNIWGKVGHVASASLTTTTENTSWYTQGTTLSIGGGTYPFSGSVQELRLWSNFISESKFNIHVLNPESIEGNITGSSFNDLATRFTLGNNLYTYNHSITTKLYSTHPDQNTQILTASFSNFLNQNNYSSFTETYYTNVANSGYANPVTDKVRIMSGSTYGTQLLPNKSIEVQSLLPTTKDIHLLDASLSPQDEIDRDIIASLGATYTIDDYIGDPSGNSLINLNKLRFDHFKKYKKPFNYKDYIRLIEFFHTSLFRTLKDFIPARTNAATGMVIKPNILERSTQKINDPGVNKHNNITSSINVLFITSSNGGGYTQPTYSYTINSNLGPVSQISDGRDFFTGELPSSSIFIHDDFDIANYNPFAINFKSDNTGSYSQSLWNVEFNPLLNNVEKNQTSNLIKKLTLIGGNFGFVFGSTYVTESFDLQDFTYSYKRHINPRYIGTKVSSLKYNTYTSTSYTGSNFSVVTGDNSYGKTAVIDRNSYKLGWVKSIPSQSFNFYDKTIINLKYLIDSDSNITELSSNNNNLFEVQNTFRSGDPVKVSITDIQNPSNQVTLDGVKNIFKGGYRYDPIIYREGNESLNFTFTSPISSILKYIGVNARSDNYYQFSAINVNDIHPAQTNDNYTLTSNDSSATQPMSYAFFTETQWNSYLGGVYGANSKTNFTYNLVYNFTNSPYPSRYGKYVWGFKLTKFNNILSNSESDSTTFNSTSADYFYKVPRTSTKYSISGQIPFYFYGDDRVEVLATGNRPGPAGFKIFAAIESTSDINNSNWRPIVISDIQQIYYQGNPTNNPQGYDNQIIFDNIAEGLFLCRFSQENITLSAGDYLRIRFYLLSVTDIFGVNANSNYPGLNKFTFVIGGDDILNGIDYNSTENGTGIFTTPTSRKTFIDIKDKNTAYNEDIYDSILPPISPLFTTSSASSSSIEVDTVLSTYYYSSSFTPSSITSRNYTQVVDTFSIQPNDLFRFGNFNSSNPQYYTVISTSNTVSGVTPVSIVANFNGPFVYNGTSYNNNSIFYDLNTYGNPFKIGDYITVSGTSNNNLSDIVIKGIYINYGLVSLDFGTLTTPFNTTGVAVSATLTRYRPSFKVNFDKNINDSILSSTNFAILRPKPDETTIIIDQKKKPGDVSQTILLPYDANQKLLDNVGKIYKDFNTDLT